MNPSINRRNLLKAGTAAAVVPLAACSGGDRLPLPADAPIGPFGAESTAEEVTADLNLAGKTALVTGCNSGIGYETMRVLALRGATVIGAARTEEKAIQACESVPGLTVPAVVELSDFDSIVAACEKIKAGHQKIDMLICNAGVMELPELEQVYGIERQFVINHLGHFLLTNLLLDLVKAAPEGRVAVVSSGQSTRGAPDQGIMFGQLSGEGWYTPNYGYGHSKLANTLFSLELNKRLAGTNARSNSLTPGVIPTNLGRHMPRWKTLTLETVGKVFTKTVPQGAATSCYVATAPGLSGAGGWFFKDCNPHRPGGHTEDSEMAAELWAVSAEIVAPWLNRAPALAANFAFGGMMLR